VKIGYRAAVSRRFSGQRKILLSWSPLFVRPNTCMLNAWLSNYLPCRRYGYALSMNVSMNIMLTHLLIKLTSLYLYLCICIKISLSVVFLTRESSAFSASQPSQFCLSVCLSVRPSVCPSHGWISQKRCKLGSPNFHRRLPGRLKFQET